MILHEVVDYDDATLPTGTDAGVSAMREYQNYRSTNLLNASGAPVVRTFKPHIAVAAYQGTFTGYKNEPFGWVDSVSNGVQGYGWKAVAEIASSGATQGFLFKLEVTANLSFRNTR
jgi:hypothetical protein